MHFKDIRYILIQLKANVVKKKDYWLLCTLKAQSVIRMGKERLAPLLHHKTQGLKAAITSKQTPTLNNNKIHIINIF